MSNAVSRKTVSTVLRIGSIETPVDLYKVTTDSQKRQKWVLADSEGNDWAPESPSVGDPLGGEPSEDSVATSEGISPGAPIGGAVPAGGGASEGVVPPGASEGVVPGGEPEPEKPRKGIRKEDGAFVDLTDQIEEITERATLEEMQVVSFIDARHVPRERIVGSYYLAGGLGGSWPASKVLAVLMRAMRQSQKVAVVRFSKRKGQTLGALTTRRDGALLLLELAFSAQVREPNGKCLAHTQVEPAQGDVIGAVRLVEAMAGKRESLDGIRDSRVVMEQELITRAEAGELDDYELAPDTEVAEETGQLGILLAEAVKAAA